MEQNPLEQQKNKIDSFKKELGDNFRLIFDDKKEAKDKKDKKKKIVKK